MGTVVKLPPGVVRRKCPGCGHKISQVEIASAVNNIACPRCAKHKLSEFVPDVPPRFPPNGKIRA